MKKSIRTLLLVIVALAVAIPLMIFYNLQKEDAPILQGGLEYNIPFAGELALDVYHPTQQVYEKNPVLIHFHGGAWITGSKESVNNARFNGAFNQLRDQGYSIVSPNYTLAELGKSPFPACIEDAITAVKWVQDHAEEYHFDLTNMGIMGESAGGHIALMTAFEGQYSDRLTQPVQLRYVVGVYGPTNLFELYQAQIPMMDSVNTMTASMPISFRECLNINQYLFGFDPADSLEVAEAFANTFSPIFKADPADPPVLMIHGDADRVVPISQSYLLQEVLDSLSHPYEFHVLEGIDHAFAGQTDQQKADIQEWISAFVLSQYYKTDLAKK